MEDGAYFIGPFHSHYHRRFSPARAGTATHQSAFTACCDAETIRGAKVLTQETTPTLVWIAQKRGC
jgi:hypothetical protein